MKLDGIKYDLMWCKTMLKTPNEKVNELTVKFIKKDYPEINTENMMQEAMDRFIVSFSNAYDKAVKKFIKQVADDEGLSFKCAEYYVNKMMNFDIELVPEHPRLDDMNIELVLIPRFKTPEELLNDIEIESYHPLKNECEKELLRASESKIKEKVKGVYDVP